MQSTSHRALLVLGLQKEFLHPPTGRCLLPNASSTPCDQPAFLNNIQALVPRFRKLGGDIIWVRSESQGRRDFTDPRAEETIFVTNDSESEDTEDENSDSKGSEIESGLARQRQKRVRTRIGGKVGGADGTGPSRPPLLTDAYLSIDTNHPPVTPETPASDWHEPFLSMINSPPDRIVTKTWYSAFKDTGLLQTLRSRIVTQLVIVGLITNVDVLATAADAGRHGLEVWVLEDCLGYRSQYAHDSAMQVMVSDFVVEKTDSITLMESWENTRVQKGVTPKIGLGASGMSKEELSKVVEGLQIGSKANPESHKPPAQRASTVIMKTATIRDLKNSGAERILSPEKANTETVPRRQINTKRTTQTTKVRKFDSTAPVLGENGKLGEGDSFIIYNILSHNNAGTAFQQLKKEVAWRSMFHRGGEVPRLVAVEGEVQNDGSFPIYRHPADESPPLLQFSPTVDLIRREVQEILNHPINHVLIQHYRDGTDYISEHSDKTLDIARGSKIVNVSLGAQRTMILRAKKDVQHTEVVEVRETNEDPGARRDMQRIPMPHNSMFVLGPETNMKWLHGIRQDKRASNIKSPPELAYNGERISLTFRHIATYLSKDERKIYGQGAQAKEKEHAHSVINGDSASTENLLEAFGAENRCRNFNWESYYGNGFDVLHFQTPKPRVLTTSNQDVETVRVKICLYEKNINFSEQVISQKQVSSLCTYNVRGKSPILIDTDRERTAINDSLAILQYLEIFYAPSQDGAPRLFPAPIEERAKYARSLTRLQEANTLLDLSFFDPKEQLDSELKAWETYLQEAEFVAGDEFSLVDIAVYPVLEKIRRQRKSPLNCCLAVYMEKLSRREGIRMAYKGLESGDCDTMTGLGQAMEKVALED